MGAGELVPSSAQGGLGSLGCRSSARFTALPTPRTTDFDLCPHGRTHLLLRRCRASHGLVGAPRRSSQYAHCSERRPSSTPFLIRDRTALELLRVGRALLPAGAGPCSGPALWRVPMVSDVACRAGLLKRLAMVIGVGFSHLFSSFATSRCAERWASSRHPKNSPALLPPTPRLQVFGGLEPA